MKLTGLSEGLPKPLPKNLLLILAVLAAAIIAFVVYKVFFEHKPEAPVSQALSLPVVRVQKAILFREDQIPGEIQAYQDVLIYPKVPGFIKWIGVDRGSIVHEGEPMVTMYAPEYLARKDEAQAIVSQARAQLAEGESKLAAARARWREANAQLLGDDSTYQRVKAASLVPGVVATNEVIVLGQQVDQDRQAVSTWESNVKAAEHLVVALRDNLKADTKSLDNFSDFASYLQITAPFDGYITERNMHVGSFVGPLGTGAYPAICRIQQLDLLRIVAPVPERDTNGVVIGAPVDFSVSTFPDQRFTGTVARLGNYLDKATRTMPVELNYNNPPDKPDRRILPGMFCKVYWPTRRTEPTLFIPQTAVESTPLDTFVCRLGKDNKVERVSVTKGQIMGSMIEVFGNIHEGDLVLETSTEEIEPGTEVQPIMVEKDIEEEKRKEEHPKRKLHGGLPARS